MKQESIGELEDGSKNLLYKFLLKKYFSQVVKYICFKLSSTFSAIKN